LIDEEKQGKSIAPSDSCSEDEDDEVQTLTEKILVKTVATAAAATMMLKKALDTRNLLRRSISLVEIVEKLA
jgi:hypothetical protein